jgi:hypothetical protein
MVNELSHSMNQCQLKHGPLSPSAICLRVFVFVVRVAINIFRLQSNYETFIFVVAVQTVPLREMLPYGRCSLTEDARFEPNAEIQTDIPPYTHIPERTKGAQ